MAEETLHLSSSQIMNEKRFEKGLWKSIAKTEVMVRTHFVRNHRGIFFGALYGILLIWAVFLAPMMFNSIFSSIIIEDVESYKAIIGLTIESLMMSVFIMLIMYPMNTVYRKTEIGFHETILASPASAKDIFLGRFMGKWPFYGTAILISTPLLAGLIGPIINLTPIQYAVIYASVFGMIFMGNLVGSVFAAWIERKISRSEKVRDWGKALIMVLAILMVIVLYSVMFFLNELLANKELRNWLMFYPALWYSNIIQHSIDPALLDGYVLDIWSSSILAIAVPAILLYLAYRKAGSFYTLEGGIEKISSSAIVNENIFYKSIRKLAGKKWGGLIVNQLKAFLRKKENYARLAYVIGLLGFFSWFYSQEMTLMDAEDLAVTQTLIIITGGLVYSLMIGTLVFVDSKDLIWVYKRSPRGVEALVTSYLMAMLVVDLIVGAGISILMSIFFALDFWGTLAFYLLFSIYSMLVMVQTVGINCFSPVYESKGGKLFANAQVTLIIQMAFFFLMIFAIFGLIPNSASLLEVRLIIYIPLLIANIGIAVPLMYFGLKKLNSME